MKIFTQGPRSPQDRPLFQLAQKVKEYGRDALFATPLGLASLTSGLIIENAALIAAGASTTLLLTALYRRRERKKREAESETPTATPPSF